MEGIQVRGNVELYEDGRFGAINLRHARVQDTLAIVGVECVGPLDMVAIHVNGHVFIGGRTQSHQVKFQNA